MDDQIYHNVTSEGIMKLFCIPHFLSLTHHLNTFFLIRGIKGKYKEKDVVTTQSNKLFLILFGKDIRSYLLTRRRIVVIVPLPVNVSLRSLFVLYLSYTVPPTNIDTFVIQMLF